MLTGGSATPSFEPAIFELFSPGVWSRNSLFLILAQSVFLQQDIAAKRRFAHGGAEIIF
ncbi:MAG: hypothetical protein WCT05_03085 [Lentisphaeria bacterium]